MRIYTFLAIALVLLARSGRGASIEYDRTLTLTYSGEMSYLYVTTDTGFSFPGFDPSLGELNFAEADYWTEYTVSETFFNPGPDGQYYTADGEADIVIAGYEMIMADGFMGMFVPPGTSAPFGWGSAKWGSMLWPLGVDPATYYSTSIYLPTTIEFGGSWAGSSIILPATASVTIDVDLYYDYTPVPEPSSHGLCGLALVVFGFAASRRLHHPLQAKSGQRGRENARSCG